MSKRHKERRSRVNAALLAMALMTTAAAYLATTPDTRKITAGATVALVLLIATMKRPGTW